MKQVPVQYTKWLLTILFIAYYSSITLFIHVHIEHGTTIVHSHPFGAKSGGSSHHHATLSEIQLFHILSSISVEDGAVQALHLNFQTRQIAEIAEVPVYPDHLLPARGQFYLRAPPVF